MSAHQLVVDVLNFIEKRVDPWMAKVKPAFSERHVYMWGMYAKTYFWLSSLNRLNMNGDFQAVNCGARSLMEVAVDLLLLHHDKTDDSILKMKWWAKSAHLKAAKTAVDHYKKSSPGLIRFVEKPNLKFIADKETEIVQMRKKLWPERKSPDRHPERWSGAQNLLADIRRVDFLFGAKLEDTLGRSLEDFYETDYRRLNWSIHGSGFITGNVMFGTDEENLRALNYQFSACFANLCLQVFLRDLWDSYRSEELLKILSEAVYLSAPMRMGSPLVTLSEAPKDDQQTSS